MAGPTTFDEYVAWYDWARRAWGADPIACHSAATAATRVLSANGGRGEAEAAAGRAASDAAIRDGIRADYGRPHRYVEWFLWARDNMRLPDERCHEAATVALRALDAGGTVYAAAEAATRLILPPPTPHTSQVGATRHEPGGSDGAAKSKKPDASSQSASAPAAATGKRTAPSADGRGVSVPVLILFSPLLLTFVMVGTVLTWLAKTMPSQRQVDGSQLDEPAMTREESPAADARLVQEYPALAAILTHGPSNPERPAIAAMITHGASLRWEAAVVATLLDLAARGHIRIVMESTGLLCRRVEAPSAERLVPFEQRLLRYVNNRLTTDGAPVEALLPDYKDEDGNHFFEDFESAVMVQAHQWDVVSSTRREARWSLQAGPGANASAAGQAAAKRWLEIRSALLTTSQPPQLPPPGASVDDPLLAWAVALGTARSVLCAMLPAGVWTSTGGHWRQVRVTNFTIWGGSSKTSAPWWSLWRRRTDQWRTVTGQVIRRGTESGYADYVGSYTVYFLAVDDGVSDEAFVWRVNLDRYRSCPLGSDVRVTVDHKQRLVDIATDNLTATGQPSAVG